MNRKWISLLVPTAAIAVAALLALQSRDVDAAAAPVPEAAPAPRSTPAAIRAEGRVAAYPGAEVVVSTEVAGTLIALPVVEDQSVHRGDLIAELRADDLRAQLDAARAARAEQEAEARLAATELERARKLLSKQVDTASRRDRAQRDLDVARARVAAATASIAEIRAELAKRRIESPIDGVVISRAVDPGETVQARVPIVTIADLGRVRVEAEVDEFDAGRVRVGQPVAVTAEGYAGATWRGTVEEVPDAVSGRRLKPQDPGRPSDTRVLIVKVRLDGPTPLKLGQRVELAIGG